MLPRLFCLTDLSLRQLQLIKCLSFSFAVASINDEILIHSLESWYTGAIAETINLSS
jgi:hypothetical protein